MTRRGETLPVCVTPLAFDIELSRLLARSLTMFSSTLEEITFSKKSVDAILDFQSGVWYNA